MSLIVREVNTGVIYLMTKGADSIMLPRIVISDEKMAVVDKHLYYFACSGLRTLVMGQK